MTLNPFLNTHRSRILDFVAKNRLPAIFGVPDIVEAGGLMSYGPDYAEHFRRSRLTWTRFSKAPSPPIFRGAAKEV